MWKTIISLISATTGGDVHHDFGHDLNSEHLGHPHTDDNFNHQRLGFQSGIDGYTPTSTHDIHVNDEVTFTDSSGNEHEGTVMYSYINGNSYDVQTTDGQTVKVFYSQIEKYRSK